WGRPVPGFGPADAALAIIGLAPAAHGGNRTGRMFTGDRSGDWLYASLHRTGFANQPRAVAKGDGLRLRDAYITATVHCAPPGNKPTPQEIANCSQHLHREFAALRRVRVVVILGKIAFDAYLNFLKQQGLLATKSGYVFAHGASYPLPDGRTLLCSFHPSLQNTNTGKLTEKMMVDVFRKARAMVEKS
ncbi:MAG TPA: uracil-DNA glycosylase, partial [Terriglobales bacterium]|nr:uracil-DNA glycosylase [Terriglobales bacterium]